jgi:hypothetical protein
MAAREGDEEDSHTTINLRTTRTTRMRTSMSMRDDVEDDVEDGGRQGRRRRRLLHHAVVER